MDDGGSEFDCCWIAELNRNLNRELLILRIHHNMNAPPNHQYWIITQWLAAVQWNQIDCYSVLIEIMIVTRIVMVEYECL